MKKRLELDPRWGLPSASQMYRLRECPGSLALSNRVRRAGLFVPEDPLAKSGTLVHRYLALDPDCPEALTLYSGFDSEERAVIRGCETIKSELTSQWNPEGVECSELIEKRLWYGTKIFRDFSGQPDFVLVDQPNKRALILDYKTGRLESEPASDNLQLRTLTVLLKHNYPALAEIQAAIVEPFVSWESDRVAYSEDNFKYAEGEILDIVHSAKWDYAQRHPGPWCKHCPARAYCAEVGDYIQTIPNPTSIEPAKLPRGEAGTRLWEKIKLAKKLLATLEETYEQILATEPRSLPGYCLPAQGRARRRVVYPEKFKTALAEYLTGEEIDGCAEYYVGKVQELFGMKHGVNGKALERKFEALTKDVVLISHDKPFIRLETKYERQQQIS